MNGSTITVRDATHCPGVSPTYRTSDTRNMSKQKRTGKYSAANAIMLEADAAMLAVPECEERDNDQAQVEKLVEA